MICMPQSASLDRTQAVAERVDAMLARIPGVDKRSMVTGYSLIDGLAHFEPKMKQLFGAKTRFQYYGRKRSMLSRFGMSLTQDALAGLEERAAFARFGL